MDQELSRTLSFDNMLFVFFLNVACVHICMQVSAREKAGGGYQVNSNAQCNIGLYLESTGFLLDWPQASPGILCFLSQHFLAWDTDTYYHTQVLCEW